MYCKKRANLFPKLAGSNIINDDIIYQTPFIEQSGNIKVALYIGTAAKSECKDRVRIWENVFNNRFLKETSFIQITNNAFPQFDDSLLCQELVT